MKANAEIGDLINRSKLIAEIKKRRCIMERLTKPDSDYCHDICGGVNGCPRLMGNKKRCSGYDLYERLKWYKNAACEILASLISESIQTEEASINDEKV